MKEYEITYSQNADQYTGHMFIYCNEIERDKNDECVFYADGIRIELDERVYDIKENE